MLLLQTLRYIFVNRITNFVYLAPDSECSKILKKGWCNSKRNIGTLWSQVCAITCGDEELCPAQKGNPSEQLPSEFHITVPMY